LPDVSEEKVRITKNIKLLS
jgi:hypothetical protein